ncbi:MAG: ribose 5-phosphate isomerase B [Sediminibacterium sp.]|nr:ribose 5-phosphate isomerase B [Sediminibacterium sp.]
MMVYIGSDHAGFEHKIKIIEFFQQKNIFIEDCGPINTNSVDYPDYAHIVSKKVLQNNNALGILICGTGNGMAITANKYPNIRAGICWNTEIAQLVKSHNNANIICIPARFTGINESIQIIEMFLNTAFEGGRHLNRINKINC